MGVELTTRVICTVQVTVENATESQLLLGTGFVFPGLLGGVGTQEVMEPVPMWHVLLQEMYLGKRFEMMPGTLLGHRHHRCRTRYANVRTWMQAQQPKDPGGGIWELTV